MNASLRPATAPKESIILRHNGRQFASAGADERLVKDFINSLLDICERRIKSGNLEKRHRASLECAAMSAKYAIETFLVLARMEKYGR